MFSPESSFSTIAALSSPATAAPPSPEEVAVPSTEITPPPPLFPPWKLCPCRPPDQPCPCPPPLEPCLVGAPASTRAILSHATAPPLNCAGSCQPPTPGRHRSSSRPCRHLLHRAGTPVVRHVRAKPPKSPAISFHGTARFGPCRATSSACREPPSARPPPCPTVPVSPSLCTGLSFPVRAGGFSGVPRHRLSRASAVSAHPPWPPKLHAVPSLLPPPHAGFPFPHLSVPPFFSSQSRAKPEL